MVVTYAIVIYYKLRQHAVGLDLSMLLGWIHQLVHSGPNYLALGQWRRVNKNIVGANLTEHK